MVEIRRKERDVQAEEAVGGVYQESGVSEVDDCLHDLLKDLTPLDKQEKSLDNIDAVIGRPKKN